MGGRDNRLASSYLVCLGESHVISHRLSGSGSWARLFQVSSVLDLALLSGCERRCRDCSNSHSLACSQFIFCLRRKSHADFADALSNRM